MSTVRVATALSPFKPNQESIHWARWEKDSSEFSSSYSKHPILPKSTPQHSSMVRNLRRHDPDPKSRVGTSTHRDFQPHPHQLSRACVPVNTRDSTMSHLDPSKTFTNVTNPDEVYRSEKETKFTPTSASRVRSINLPPSRMVPTQEFHDRTTSRDYQAYDLSTSCPRQALTRGREGSTRIGGDFEGVSSSQRDYPPHAIQPVRRQAAQPGPNRIATGPLSDSTLHRQFFIPHTPNPPTAQVPPSYRKESLSFEENTSYNTFFPGHKEVPRTSRYEPINGKLFSTLPPDMRTQTALHFPPKSAAPYFAPVPVTYRAPEGPLDGPTSQRIDYPGYSHSRPAASAKPPHRPLTGDFHSSRTNTEAFQPLLLARRPPPSVDKHGIYLPQDRFIGETTTKSAFIGAPSQPPDPIRPIPAKHGDRTSLEHATIYKSSYNS